jgi:hypothetical protein
VNREEHEYKTEVWNEVKNSMYFDSLFKSFLNKRETCFERVKHTVKSKLREFATLINDWWKNMEISQFISITVTILSLVGMGSLVYACLSDVEKVCYSCKKSLDDCSCTEELKELQDL